MENNQKKYNGSIAGSKKADEKAVGFMAKQVVDGLADKDEETKIKRIAENIFKWSVGGKDSATIMGYLGLTQAKYDELMASYPLFVGAMAKGKEYANSLMGMTMYEMAMGMEYEEEVIVKYSDTYEKVRITKRIDPSVQLRALQYLMENKMGDVWGKERKEKDESDIKEIVRGLSVEERKQVLDAMRKKKIADGEIVDVKEEDGKDGNTD